MAKGVSRVLKSCDTGHSLLCVVVYGVETCRNRQLAPLNPDKTRIQARDSCFIDVNARRLTAFCHTLSSNFRSKRCLKVFQGPGVASGVEAGDGVLVDD